MSEVKITTNFLKRLLNCCEHKLIKMVRKQVSGESGEMRTLHTFSSLISKMFHAAYVTVIIRKIIPITPSEIN